MEVKISGLLPVGTFLIFLYLKLTDKISWSWWWVTCPLWIGVVLLVLFGVLGVIIYFIKELLK